MYEYAFALSIKTSVSRVDKQQSYNTRAVYPLEKDTVISLLLLTGKKGQHWCNSVSMALRIVITLIHFSVKYRNSSKCSPCVGEMITQRNI